MECKGCAFEEHVAADQSFDAGEFSGSFDYGTSPRHTCGPIEAYGVKGMKSAAWRRTFKTVDALNKWLEKNDAEVQGTRFISEEER